MSSPHDPFVKAVMEAQHTKGDMHKGKKMAHPKGKKMPPKKGMAKSKKYT